MIYASVCDGIGAAHVAWQPLGWRCAWTGEIEPFPIAVVDHHWGFPNLGDMTRITDDDLNRHGPVDLLVGGTPCQSFSVAGLRKGLADPRGNLALVYLGLVDRLRPRWVVWENVPGVLSSGRGRDFGAFLGALGQLGYGFAYRVLDAQFVRVQSHPRAVPQRRRRVFVVGHLGDWRPAAQVLLEREGLCGHPPPRRVAGEGLAGTLAARTRGGGYPGTDEACEGHCIAIQERAGAERGGPGGKGYSTDGAAYTLEARHHVQATAHTLRAEGFDASEDGTGRGTPLVPQPYPVGNCLTRRMHKGINTTCDEGQTPVIGFAQNQRDEVRTMEAAGALAAEPGMKQQTYVQSGLVVRRLLPVECERLQGFPDDYTAITYRGKPAADGPRYKALGNSMACNVMSWIGQRIEGVSL